MRILWRRMPAAGFDHELVWLAVSVTALMGGLVWRSLGLSWPECPFLVMTGWPCLTCGATRATFAFLEGNFQQAFSWNPLAALALGGVVAFDLYAVVVLLSRRPRLRIVAWTKSEARAAWIGVSAAILINWIYLLAHRDRF